MPPLLITKINTERTWLHKVFYLQHFVGVAAIAPCKKYNTAHTWLRSVYGLQHFPGVATTAPCKKYNIAHT
jgi:hypothetical protein